MQSSSYMVYTMVGYNCDIILCAIGESPLIWEDMAKGNHTIIVSGLCLSNRSSKTRRKKIRFQVR